MIFELGRKTLQTTKVENHNSLQKIMAEENTEETIENPEEVETSEEKPTVEEQATSEKPVKESSEVEDANKKLYARMKKAEEEAKELKAKLEKSEKAPRGDSPIDVFDLAKTVSALRDYSVDELGDIQMIARAKGISPEEAVKTEEAQLIITARREKVAKNKAIPDPSNVSSGGFKVKSQAEIAELSPVEHRAYAEEYTRRKGMGQGV